MAQPVNPSEDIHHIALAWAMVMHRANVPQVQDELMARAGLSLDRASYSLLNILAQADCMRLSDLAQRQGTDVSTVSRQVRHCEEAGLVLRKEHPSDQRAVLLALTNEGRDALARLRRVREELFAEIMSSWSEEDRHDFARLLTRYAADFISHIGAWS